MRLPSYSAPHAQSITIFLFNFNDVVTICFIFSNGETEIYSKEISLCNYSSQKLQSEEPCESKESKF